MMSNKKSIDEKVDVDFEAHPPIDDDLDGIIALLKQTLLHYSDCSALARHLITMKDLTQVIALDCPDEDDSAEGDDEEDEPDNDIYGVSSVVDLSSKTSDEKLAEAIKQLQKFLKDKNPEIRRILESEDKIKLGLIINERYINLPPQLALPSLKSFQNHLDKSSYTHLVLISKILVQGKNSDAKLPNKKAKSDSSKSEPIVFVNAEEEIISENADHHSDIDVSAHCDENATWSMSSDVKYIPHRRIMLLDCSKWPKIIKEMEKELGS